MTAVTIIYQYSFGGFNQYNKKEVQNKYQKSKILFADYHPKKSRMLSEVARYIINIQIKIGPGMQCIYT